MIKNYNWVVFLLLFQPIVLFGQSTGGIIAGWFDTEEYINNNSMPRYRSKGFEILQYDSGYRWLDSTGKAQPFNTFAAGHVFDVTHDLWAAIPSDPNSPILPLLHRCSFYWDSIRFNYFYLRGNPDTAIVDTLFIYYYCNFFKADTQLATTTYPLTYPDTINTGYPRFFNSIELSGARYFQKDTLLLTFGDTVSINGKKHISRAVGISYNGSLVPFNDYGMFGYSLAFKPGIHYAQGDTLFDARDSSFYGNLLGIYYTDAARDSMPWMITKLFKENSFWLDKNNRYGGTYNGKEGFIPGWLLPKARFLHGAAFITSYCTISVNEIDKPGIKLFPNPALSGENIYIETGSQLPGQTTIVITDMLGREVYRAALTANSSSSYIINPILTNGVYTITITDASSNNKVHSARLFVAR